MVLVSIIVAIGIAIAITYFISNQQDANINETINELSNITAEAQEWYRKPSQLGGGNGSFAGFTLAAISQADSTQVATFTVVSAKGDSLALEAIGADYTVDVNVTHDQMGKCQVTKGKGKVNPKANSNGNGNSKGNSNGNGNGN